MELVPTTATLLLLLLVATSGSQQPIRTVSASAASSSPPRPVVPNHHAAPVESRVAELEFTRSWFQQQSVVRVRDEAVERTGCAAPGRPDEDLTFGMGYDSVTDEVERANCWIQRAHRDAGNVDVDYMLARGAEIVHAAGVSELLVAAIIAIADMIQAEAAPSGAAGEGVRIAPAAKLRPVVTANAAPYYAVLKLTVAAPALAAHVDWVEPDAVAAGNVSGRPLIVVAIAPNNPIGSSSAGLLAACAELESEATSHLIADAATTRLRCFGSPTRVVSDHSFMWPCLVAPTSPQRQPPPPSDTDSTVPPHDDWAWRWPLRPVRSSALLFGLSKLSGHSGVRHAWAWIPHRGLARAMRHTLWTLGVTLSATSVAQSSLVLAAIAASEGRKESSGGGFHAWCRAEMARRWEALGSIPTIAMAMTSTTVPAADGEIALRSNAAVRHIPAGTLHSSPSLQRPLWLSRLSNDDINNDSPAREINTGHSSTNEAKLFSSPTSCLRIESRRDSAFAFVRCSDALLRRHGQQGNEGGDCAWTIGRATEGLLAAPGTAFGEAPTTARIALGVADSAFREIISRLSKMQC